jgi:ubiquinone/menaquinone biosynthesis C-methylase UbiE
MSITADHINEEKVAAAFSEQSFIFDDLYAEDGIIQYKRNRVRDHVLKLLLPSSNILELNSGTGEDAVFFASLGHRVHATDISAGMQNVLSEKVACQQLTGSVTKEVCSFTALNTLKNKGPYDCLFSNFAGLNCTGDLDSVLDSFDDLLKPGGIVVLVLLPKFCLWESLLIFKGKFKTATRRFFSSKGVKAKIGENAFSCWYYSPSFVIRQLKGKYELLGIEGLCAIVPPSYFNHFSDKYPKAFSRLCGIENNLKARWPWKYIGDYYIISLRKI